MNDLIWTIAIAISIAGMFLILNPTPNIAAYSCSSSSSSHRTSVSSGVSGTSGSCVSSASSSSNTQSIGGGSNTGSFPQWPNQQVTLMWDTKTQIHSYKEGVALAPITHNSENHLLRWCSEMITK